MSALVAESASLEAEVSCLASAFLNLEALDRVLSTLTAAHFESPRHRAIFTAMRALRTAGEPINRVTTRRQLEKDGTLGQIGGGGYLAELTEQFPVVANIDAYIGLVTEGWKRREALAISLDLSRELNNPGCEPARVASDYAGRLASVAADGIDDDEKSWVHRALDREEWLLDLGSKGAGVGWPLPELTRMVKTFQRDQLVIIGGLYSHGKTWLGLQTALGTAKAGKPTKIYSYEMETSRVAARLNWFHTCINPNKVTDETRGAWNQGYSEMAKLPLWISDRDDLADFDRVVIDMERAIRKYKVELFIFDYLRLMRMRGHNGPAEVIPAISMAFKQLVKRLGVDIVLLHQINKSVESQKRRPQVSDCEYGGNTDCDIGIVVNQPARYKTKEDFKGPNQAELYRKEIPDDRYTQIIVGKNRNGSCGIVHAGFCTRRGIFAPAAEFPWWNQAGGSNAD